MLTAGTTYLDGKFPNSSAVYIWAKITAPSGNNHYVCNGPQLSTFYGSNATRGLYQWTLKSVSAVSMGVDPFTRAYSDSDCELEILDVGASDGFRLFQSANRMLGATVEVRFGFELGDLGSTSNTTSLPYWKGQVVDVIPEEGLFRIRCATKMWLALQRDSGKQYFNKHPLELISTLLTDAGVPSGSIDTTSLTASTWTDISHFVVSTAVYSSGEPYDSGASSRGSTSGGEQTEYRTN
jgi:hypothetical protein